MNRYAAAGFGEFVIALGYKGEVIKDYFRDFYARNNDLTIDLAAGEVRVHGGRQPPWRIHLVDTGPTTATGGRVKRLRSWLGDETFLLTYGDGLADLDLADLVRFHRSHGKRATVTAVRPPARYGALDIQDGQVLRFDEKPVAGEGWINGGFFVLEPEVIDYVEDDQTPWEAGPLERLARDGQLMAYQHAGFWQAMDTLRERNHLEQLWASGQAPWKNWEE
jgi:glucose-1-phosphate cytidylyltransferase